MTRRVRGLSVTLATLVLLLGGVPRAAEASLIGDSVTCSGSLSSCSPPTATVGAGSEFRVDIGADPFFGADLAASSITLTFVFPVPFDFIATRSP